VYILIFKKIFSLVKSFSIAYFAVFIVATIRGE